MTVSLRHDAEAIFLAGVAAAEPALAVRRALAAWSDGGPVVSGVAVDAESSLRLVAVGKAACGMTEGVLAVLAETEVVIDGGIVVTDGPNLRAIADADRHGIAVRVAGHPLPNAASAEAAREVSRLVAGLAAGDALLVLLSGGASALLAAPVESVTLGDKVKASRVLLASGADITEINTVRKHLSELKGGGLASLALPARVEILILSDVIGDDLSVVASGPTIGDPTTFADAVDVLERHGLMDEVPPSVRQHLERGLAGRIPETPKPGDLLFGGVHNVLVGSNGQSLDAAAAQAKQLGYETVVVSRALSGEAREAGAYLWGELQRITKGRSRRLALLAGGETTVTVRGKGRGGRNQEVALAFALAAYEGHERAWILLSGGTDGRDGPTDAAGAVVDAGTIKRGESKGRHAIEDLTDNNAYAFFEASGDLLMTGPTGTNVADLQVVLVGEGREGRGDLGS